METVGGFFVMKYKRDNFCNFLFAFLCTKALLNRDTEIITNFVQTVITDIFPKEETGWPKAARIKINYILLFF